MIPDLTQYGPLGIAFAVLIGAIGYLYRELRQSTKERFLDYQTLLTQNTSQLKSLTDIISTFTASIKK